MQDTRDIWNVCPQTAFRLDLYEQVAECTKGILLLLDPEKYTTFLGEMQQNTAVLVRELPIWRNRRRMRSVEEEDRKVFSVYIGYRMRQGTLDRRTAAILIREKIIYMLNFLL